MTSGAPALVAANVLMLALGSGLLPLLRLARTRRDLLTRLPLGYAVGLAATGILAADLAVVDVTVGWITLPLLAAGSLALGLRSLPPGAPLRLRRPPPSGLGPDLDLPSAVAAAGRFYLLPAVQATSLADATVVVSYFEDPSLLHLRFVTQVQAGEQPLYVSRIRAP